MTRLALRLTFNGGKEAAVRLAITAAAVGLGVGLLLIALSGMNALKAQNDRTAWLDSSMPALVQGTGRPILPNGPTTSGKGAVSSNPSTSDPLWWLFNEDHFRSQPIDRVDVAATGAHSPVPPGIAHLPGPGQFYASPALSRLIRSVPAAELGDRFPGKEIGTIGSAALPSPNSLIVVIGHDPSELSRTTAAGQITSINTSPGLRGSTGWDANKLQILLAVGALALLFPVLIFIGTATRLSAARREQRFAAIRLVGGTPRQVALISAVEASVAAVLGVAAGFVLFFLLRAVLAKVPFTGEPFAPGDLSLRTVDVVLVVFGVPLASAAAARVALRRVQISPLGVSRRATPPAPRAYRLVPLLAGIAELTYFVAVGRPGSTGGQIEAYFFGCLLTMAGLVIAGPWLTMVGSRVMARRTNRPAVLIAGRRLSDNPRAAFRAISGLIVALFATTVSVGVITTIVGYAGTPGGGSRDTLIQEFLAGPSAPGGSGSSAASVPEGLVAALHSVPGVRGVTVVHDTGLDGADNAGPSAVVASCAQLVATPALGRCAPGAQVAAITANLDDSTATKKSTLAATVWPAAAVSPARLQALPVRAIVVSTSGSGSPIERARTVLAVALPGQNPATTLGEISAQNTRLISELRQLTDVVIIVSLVIAGCSLAVSVTAGVSERKRPFSRLRLTGVPLRVLHQVVALEAAVPLLVIAVLSTATGLLAAELFLRSQLGESLKAPGLDYYLIVLTGLGAALGIIASSLPLIDRITGPETARNE